MKRDWVVVLLVVLTLLVSSALASAQFTTANQLGISGTTISRVADFTQNGFYDILTFSDRLDTTPRRIALYTQNNNSFSLNQTINETLFRQCSMSYQDANKNGNLELFFACFNTTLELNYYEFQNNAYIHKQSFQTANTFSTNGFGDTLFFDFTGDGYADIVSCYLGNGTHLEILINEKTVTNGKTDFTKYSTPIQTNLFNANQNTNTINQCYLVHADIDGDGDFDIIAYTYDGTQISLFQNQYCNLTGCGKTSNNTIFTQLDANEFYNATFFAQNKIKNLRAFDSNHDGFSDLYYIVQTGQIGSNRTIEFGFFENKKRSATHTLALTTPQIANIAFVQDNPRTNNYSWVQYNNTGNYYVIEITPSQLLINGTPIDNQNIFYNINFSHSEYEFGDYFESNYDYNAGYGNLLYRTKANVSLPHLNYTVTVQAISASGFKSAISTPYQLNTTFTYYNGDYEANTFGFTQEFCDGFANTNISKIDSSFTIRFPNNETKRVILDADGDGYYAQDYKVSSTDNQYNVTISCSSRFVFLQVQADSNDNDRCVGANNLATGLCTTQTSNQGTTGSAGGGGFAGGIPTTPGATAIGDTNLNIPQSQDTQSQTPTQTQEQPANDEQKSSTSSIEQFTTTTKEFESTFKLEFKGGKTYVTESIKKIRPGDVKSLTIIKTFPKEILSGASQLESLTPFTIIRENPIIAFDIQNWNYLENQVLSYVLPGEVTLAQVRQIQSEFTNIVYTTDVNALLIELERQAQVANQSLITQIEERIVDNKTQIVLKIDLKDDALKAQNVEVEQYIPKCLIEEITDLVLEAGVNTEFLNQVQIKEADPIIVWNFKEVTRGQEITFTLPVLRDEDCTDEIKIQTLAKEFIRKNYDVDQNNVFMALAYTLAIFAFFLVLFKITTHEQTHDNPHIHRLAKEIIKRYHKGETLEQIKSTLVHDTSEDIELAMNFAQNSKHFQNKWLHHYSERSLEIFIFIILLILNVAEFSGFEYALMDWTKKVISWLLILVLLYKVDLTKVFFNNSQKFVNWLLICGMFLMHIKILVSFSHTQLFNKNIAAATQIFGVSSNFIFDLYAWISNNSIYFTYYAFVAGAILLAIAAVRIAYIEIKQGCVYFLLTRHPIAHTWIQKLKRATKVYLLFMLFFFAIFNKMLEWLAIAIDTFIFIATLIFLIGMIFSTKLYHKEDKKHHSFFTTVLNVISHSYIIALTLLFVGYLFVKPFIPYADYIGYGLLGLILIVSCIVIVLEIKNKFSQLEHITTAVDSIYLKTLKLFEYPGTIFVAIAGLVVLQNIVEICLFIVPQILGKETSMYASAAHAADLTLLSLFTQTSIVSLHLFSLSLVDKILFGLLYAVAIFGFFCLFSLPILLWVIYFKHRNMPPSKVNITTSIDEQSTLGKCIYALNYVAFPSMIIALLSQIVKVKPILELTASQDIGVLFIAQQTIFTRPDIIVALSALILYAIATKFIPKKYSLYAMFLLSIVLFILIYVTSFVYSIVNYIMSTWIYAHYALDAAIIYTILTFIALDTLLVYGLGLAILWYFTLPLIVKSKLTQFLTSHHMFGRYFYLANDMQHLEYYEHARHEYAQDLVRHLEKYVAHEEKQGHSIETIMMQLKLHNYPDALIDQAFKELLTKPEFIHELEHLKAIHIDPLRIKRLVPNVRRELKRGASATEVFEIYLAEYSYLEIKLALRYATQQTKGRIELSQIEKDEFKLLDDILEHIHAVQNWPIDKIETHLVQKGYNPALVFMLAQSSEFRQPHLDIFKSYHLYEQFEMWKEKPTDAQVLYELCAKYSYREIKLALEAVLNEWNQSHEQFLAIHRYVKENGDGERQLKERGYPQSFIDFAIAHPHSKTSAKFLASAVRHM
jgi:hypothetical protein